MKIIIVPFSPKMTGRHYCLAKQLVKQGHEVHYLLWELPYRLSFTDMIRHFATSILPKHYRYEEFEMHKVQRLPFFWPYINGWLFKRQVRKLYKSLDADFVIAESFTNETEMPKNIPFIYDLADDYAAPADVYGGLIYKLAFKLLDVRGVMERQAQNAKAVTAVSEILYKFAKQHNTNSYKLPNGVEKELIEEVLNTPKTTSKNPHSIVYATGFGHWSRAIETLEAITMLRDDFPDIDLTLIGEGSETENIKRYISENHADNYIHYLGYVYDRKKLFSLISQSAIGLNISDKNKWRDASHPMKVMDYCALGLKTVSTDLTEVKALNFPNIYIFSDSGKNDQLADALLRALKDTSSYESVSRDVLEKYSWEDLTARLIKLFTFKVRIPGEIKV